MEEDIQDLEPQLNNEELMEDDETDEEDKENDQENPSEDDNEEDEEKEERENGEDFSSEEEEEEEKAEEQEEKEEEDVSGDDSDEEEDEAEDSDAKTGNKSKIMDSVFVVEKSVSQDDSHEIKNESGKDKKNKLTKLKNKLKEQIQKQAKRGKSLVKTKKQKSETETGTVEADNTRGPFTQLEKVKRLDYGQDESEGEGSVQINTSDEDTPFEDEQILVKTPPQRKKMVANVGKYSPLVSTFKSPSGSFTVSSLTENPSVKTVHKGMQI